MGSSYLTNTSATAMDDVYGFDRKGNRFKQLKNLLDMEDDQFDVIKGELEDLANSYLDVEGPFAHQQYEAMEKIRRRLVNLRPNIWGKGPDSNKRLHFARRAIMAIHIAHRKNHALLDVDYLDQEEQNLSPNWKLHTSDSPSRRKYGRSPTNPSKVQPVKVTRRRSPLSKIDSSVIDDRDNSPDIPGSTVAKDKLSSMHFLKNFLATCEPPMNQYLHLFVGYGPEAQWEPCLRALAGNFSSVDRQDVLRKILSDQGKKVPMEIDVVILNNHFKTYFQ